MFWQVDHLIALAIHPFQETWDVPDCLQSCTAQEEGMNDTRLCPTINARSVNQGTLFFRTLSAGVIGLGTLCSNKSTCSPTQKV